MFNGEFFNALTLIVALIALVVGIFAARYGRRALFPAKRRLMFSALPPAPLLAAESVADHGVSVTYQGRDLTNPHVATISVENNGRHALSSDQFDQDRPIVIDVGVPIRAILKASMIPDSGRAFKNGTDGTEIRLGPDLLNPGETLVLQVLTDGVPETSDLDGRITAFLGDTKLDYRIDNGRTSSRGVGAVAGAAVVAAMLFIVVGGAVAYAVNKIGEVDVSMTPDNGPTGTAVTVTGSDFDRYEVITVLIDPMPVWITPSPTPAPSDESSSDSPQPSPSPSLTRVDQPPVAQVQADKDGDFTATFTVPPGYPKGRLELTVRGESDSGDQYSYEWDTPSVTKTFYVR
ncbi:IPT/TIG domain-containing protein [Actinoplanes bogorensis]|uniref:IPT/TIG domain-containing protein n=1 Tax=Paractinoplanes bogorensis TaxID=1610840 RepID=A0ABS5YKJ9_9ACTN|nr:IPT/TIG domain-containing protein [Actinoplanes bogorensis]MBU2664002.1 IPT/TIG domain-containing protein [Actinoplanes bogorensis]